jgi:2-oxoglutarate dehydrogenase E2 component (dihydrolipoamide succinyltransferase)
MSTEVVMPQMGESIAEGTITRWLKKVGERVERDEPLFEISTDKVDAEIPSPAAGVLSQILFNEGDTVEVNKVVAILNGGDGAAAPPAEAPKAEATPAAQPAPPQAAQPAPPVAPQPPAPVQPQPAAPTQAQPPAQWTTGRMEPTPEVIEVEGRSYDYMRPGAVEEAEQPLGDKSAEELRRLRSSPLVRNIAKEHGIDIARLEGTGMSGRVTKNDIMSFIESGAALTPQQAMQPQAKAPTAPSIPSVPTPALVQPPAAPVQPMTGDRVEQMSVMRKKIAEHMTLSRRTSAHVTTVYEIDMTRVVKLRDQYKDAFYLNVGTKLSYMPFIFQAVTSAIRQFPVFNSQVSGDQIIYKRDINLGMAVALDWGLIVPVIKRADELSIAGLARAANDLADRARTKQLKPDDVAGGTFTITNPGVFGGLFGTPIINQPQVAILGVGAIVKRPKVVTSEEGDDYIAIRHMAYFALTFDHRIIDGSDAEKFLGYVKQILEAGQFVIQ